jgi:outer membrane biosynthesis protein TonB
MLCESERACDDAVIRSGFSGSAFARDLVEIAQSIHSKGDSFMSIAVTTKLERRIARLIDPAANRRPLTAARTALGAALALTLLLPIAAVKAEQTFKTPPVVAPPPVTLEHTLEPSVKPDPGVAAPKREPRAVTQISQAQIGQTATQPQSSPAGFGSLSGVVSDPTGAVVAGATVRIQFSPSPGSYSAVTDPTGQWSFSAVPTGMYTLEIQVPGFRNFNRTVAVTPGANNPIRANLMLGRASESLTVVAEKPELAPAPAIQTSSRPIRISAGVQPAKLIRSVTPVFPQSARDKGLQGAVTFEAVIDKAGFIREIAQLGFASPDLVEAARDAIRLWQYTPALLNGEPVELITEITVNFQLQ